MSGSNEDSALTIKDNKATVEREADGSLAPKYNTPSYLTTRQTLGARHFGSRKRLRQ